MKTITLKQPEFMPTLHRRYRNFCEPQRRSTSIPIMNSCSPNSQSRKNEKISVEVQSRLYLNMMIPQLPHNLSCSSTNNNSQIKNVTT
ncbi:hypothetical protein GIB67_035546 [Kingdonia uniflora]|uniref:Uncharacterized protein n=1 Tax=Kingdonia uniflora TaxID=39325 RepID=A0A7J7LD89_9MAGN|nr:hypothetical protein GIB67_035546 [Kingdonia uniflora]